MKLLVHLLMSVGVLAGCQAPQPFNAARTVPRLREILDARVGPGAGLDQVQAALVDLRVQPIDQVVTETPSGPRLHAWIWEPGGPWPPDGPDDFFKWAEAKFQFDQSRRLEGYEITKHAVLGISMRFPLDPRHDPQVRTEPANP